MAVGTCPKCGEVIATGGMTIYFNSLGAKEKVKFLKETYGHECSPTVVEAVPLVVETAEAPAEEAPKTKKKK